MSLYYLVLYLMLSGLVAHVLILRKVVLWLRRMIVQRVETSKERPKKLPAGAPEKQFPQGDPPALAGDRQAGDELPFLCSDLWD